MFFSVWLQGEKGSKGDNGPMGLPVSEYSTEFVQANKTKQKKNSFLFLVFV